MAEVEQSNSKGSGEALGVLRSGFLVIPKGPVTLNGVSSGHFTSMTIRARYDGETRTRHLIEGTRVSVTHLTNWYLRERPSTNDRFYDSVFTKTASPRFGSLLQGTTLLALVVKATRRPSGDTDPSDALALLVGGLE